MNSAIASTRVDETDDHGRIVRFGHKDRMVLTTFDDYIDLRDPRHVVVRSITVPWISEDGDWVFEFSDGWKHPQEEITYRDFCSLVWQKKVIRRQNDEYSRIAVCDDKGLLLVSNDDSFGVALRGMFLRHRKDATRVLQVLSIENVRQKPEYGYHFNWLVELYDHHAQAAFWIDFIEFKMVCAYTGSEYDPVGVSLETWQYHELHEDGWGEDQVARSRDLEDFGGQEVDEIPF